MFKQRVQGFITGILLAAIAVGGYLLIPGQSPEPELDEFASSLGIQIRWSTITRCSIKDPNAVGCFEPDTPDVIWVSPDLEPRKTRHIVLHEIGHAIHFRLGMPTSECRADRFAQSMGSKQGFYCPTDPYSD